MQSAAPTALAGTSVKPIWRNPSEMVSRNPSTSLRAARRESAGKSTVAIATEKMPWGSM